MKMSPILPSCKIIKLYLNNHKKGRFDLDKLDLDNKRRG